MKSFFDVHRQAQARYDALMKPYILDADGRPTPIDMSTDAGWMAWSEWFDTADRKVAHDQLGIEDGQPAFEISTVFLGLEHGQDEAGVPRGRNDTGSAPVREPCSGASRSRANCRGATRRTHARRGDRRGLDCADAPGVAQMVAQADRPPAPVLQNPNPRRALPSSALCACWITVSS